MAAAGGPERPSSYGAALCYLSVILLCCVGGCSGRREVKIAARCNLLLVTLDTTRRDHLGCYGHRGGLTPYLDALARDGVIFDRAVSTSASTPPSHASIMTGLNPYRHGVRVIYAGSGYRLADDIPTLATVLRESGRSTGAFLSSFTVSSFFGFDRGFDVFDEGLSIPADESLSSREDGFWDWPLRENQRRSDATTDRAVAWLESVEEPFFAWVHYWDPHDIEILPPTDTITRFVSADMDGETRRRMAYQAEIFYMDSQFGRLMQALKERGLFEQTIVVVVADHGQGLGDHGWWYHRILYEEQIHVPLIMRVPGWPTGRVVADLVRTIDIAPTVYDVLGVDVASGMDGASLSGLVRGEPQTPRIAYAEAINLFDLNAIMMLKRPDDGLVYCAAQGAWKLIHRPTHHGKDELYDLSADPDERVNLIQSRAEQVARLQRELDRCNGYVHKPFGEALDAEVLERLKSLGYVGKE